MTLPGFMGVDLGAMLAGPLGADVVLGDSEFRGILTREYRDQEDASGLTQQVFTTILTVRDSDLPSGTREGATLTVDDVSYTLRRKGRIDDMGARELYVVEVTA